VLKVLTWHYSHKALDRWLVKSSVLCKVYLIERISIIRFMLSLGLVQLSLISDKSLCKNSINGTYISKK
jgi:hypothetical protein